MYNNKIPVSVDDYKMGMALLPELITKI